MNIKHKKKLIILGGVLAVLIGIYNYYVVSGTWRYKVTVEISTPEGVKSGSTVNEVSNSAARARSKVSLSQGGNPADFRGEAVVVDLGERGKVFSLLVGPKHFYRAFNGMSGPTTAEGIQYFNKIPIGKEAVLDPKYYPMVVTFTDMSDPKSVTLVKGWKFNPQTQKSDPVDRFEELFGEGVSIKEIRLERTKEPITHNLDQYLPEKYNEVVVLNWRKLSVQDRRRMGKLTKFKGGR